MQLTDFSYIIEVDYSERWLSIMSERERVAQMVNDIPDYKLGYVLAYMQGLMADEVEDDAFCEQLYQDYLDDPDPEKDTEYSLEDCKKEWGLE